MSIIIKKKSDTFLWVSIYSKQVFLNQSTNFFIGSKYWWYHFKNQLQYFKIKWVLVTSDISYFITLRRTKLELTFLFKKKIQLVVSQHCVRNCKSWLAFEVWHIPTVIVKGNQSDKMKYDRWREVKRRGKRSVTVKLIMLIY